MHSNLRTSILISLMTPSIDTALNDSVKAAKELFWRQGYDETSIEDIVGATGFNRYAIYNAFGGKLELFLTILENYYIERKNLFLTVLSDPKNGPIDAIREVSEYCITEMTDRHAGCLMCNVALEVGRYDEVVSERVGNYLEQIQSAKEMALTQAAQRGELNPAITPQEGAALLMANMLGGGALARSGATCEELLNLLNTCLSLLSHPAHTLNCTDKHRNPKIKTVCK